MDRKLVREPFPGVSALSEEIPVVPHQDYDRIGREFKGLELIENPTDGSVHPADHPIVSLRHLLCLLWRIEPPVPADSVQRGILQELRKRVEEGRVGKRWVG